MPIDDERSIRINPELDQHFLSNPVRLALVVKAAGIRPTDHVVEAGAGIGTVAEYIPACERLTVIEYDRNLIPYLRKRVPRARVIQGDALRILPTVHCNVLLSNLPWRLTPALVELLPRLEFRVALVAVSSIDKLALLNSSFVLEAVTVLEPDDFRPRQMVKTAVVRITRAEAPTI